MPMCVLETLDMFCFENRVVIQVSIFQVSIHFFCGHLRLEYRGAGAMETALLSPQDGQKHACVVLSQVDQIFQDALLQHPALMRARGSNSSRSNRSSPVNLTSSTPMPIYTTNPRGCACSDAQNKSALRIL